MADNLRELKPHPDPNIIEALEELLEQARTGELRSIIWLAITTNDRQTGNAGVRYSRDTVMGQCLGLAFDYYMRRREKGDDDG